MTTFENITIDTRGSGALRYGWITLNRPKQLNAINAALTRELNEALQAFDEDDHIGCVVITGNEKAFAAGADITEMADKTFVDVYKNNFIAKEWEPLRAMRKPVIAAVAGFALGGGCELAMMCDFIIAADNARFGQPEIKIGIMPGLGGTQRLPRAVGKSKAMDMVLTARMMDATEAERAGLVSRVVALDQLQTEAQQAASAICDMPLLSIYACKEAVSRAFESPLAEGLSYERRLFHSLFATADQKEGMRAFMEKRPSQFTQG